MPAVHRTIGVLVKSTDVVTEADIRGLLPPAVRLLSTRVQINPGEPVSEMLPRVEAAAAVIRDVVPEVVLFACASGTFAGGARLDAEVADRIRQHAGCDCVTAASALVSSVRRAGIQDALLVTPYSAEIDRSIAGMLRTAGTAVASTLNLRYAEIFQPAFLSSFPKGKNYLVDPSWLHRFTLDHLQRCPSVDGIVIGCTGLRVSEVIADLERDTGLPVIAANQSLAAEAQRKLGLAIPVAGYGRLLEHP